MLAEQGTSVRGGVAAAYRSLAYTAVEGHAADVSGAAARVFAAGGSARMVYHVVARALLPRAVLAPQRAAAHGLGALTAAMRLGGALAPAEAQALLTRAAGWAAGALPPSLLAAPHALPRQPASLRAAWSATDLGEQMSAAARQGDGPRAEWALARLLAGADHATLAETATRRAAYAAILRAAATAERARDDWGHVLLASHAEVEMAERLPTSLAFLALRPALWAVARAHASRPRPSAAAAWADASHIRCALRINQRRPRPGETAQWARALGTGAVARTVEEALASGLAAGPLLDAALLAALVSGASAPGNPDVGGRAAHAILALHGARRAWSLASDLIEPAIIALDLLQRLPSRATFRLGRMDHGPFEHGAIPTASALARAVAAHPTPQTALFGAAVLAECAGAEPRAPDYATALLAALGGWLGTSGPSAAHGSPASASASASQAS